MSMFLTKDEVAELTGRKIKTKQIEQLRQMRILFWINAHGVPVVPRSAIEGKGDKKPEPERQWVPPGMREPNG